MKLNPSDFESIPALTTENERVPWPVYAVNMAIAAISRSQDPNTKVGACLLNHKHRIISVGYNGLPDDICIEKFNIQSRHQKLHCFIHAETNALSLVKKGEGKILGLTHSPCLACATNIAAYNIPEVYYALEYHRDTQFKDYFDIVGIKYSLVKPDFSRIISFLDELKDFS